MSRNRIFATGTLVLALALSGCGVSNDGADEEVKRDMTAQKQEEAAAKKQQQAKATPTPTPLPPRLTPTDR